jgi:tRNA pseudouridine55 synthase
MNGLLLVDKPGLASPAPEITPDDARAYPTSHDVVQQVRRASHQRRIGHTGTLDPMASGLLVLCLGRATRLVEYYQGHPKRYRAEITLGYATDTYDALGTITQRLPVPALSTESIEQALAPMRGEVMQTPPVYAALKQGGESIHYKARRGEEVTVKARAVTFHALTLIAFNAPDRIVLDIHCSAGAYIRSLAVDLGHALGTAATLTSLRRTAAGPFGVDEAHTPAQIAAAAAAGTLPNLLLSPGARLDLPVYTALDDVIRRLGHGQVVQADELRAAAPPDSEAALPSIAQVRSADGLLLGIIRHSAQSTSAAGSTGWRAEKWFA